MHIGHREATSAEDVEIAQRLARQLGLPDHESEQHAALHPGERSNKYSGNLFSTRGDYTEGMAYASRVRSPSLTERDLAARSEKERAKRPVRVRKVLGGKRLDDPATRDVKSDMALFHDEINARLQRDKSLRAKQECAAAFCNMAKNHVIEAQIVEEGAVGAIVGLAETEDPYIWRDCSAALAMLGSRLHNQQRLLRDGAVPTLVRIAAGHQADGGEAGGGGGGGGGGGRGGSEGKGAESSKELETKVTCALALCNLTLQPGYDEQFISTGALATLLHLRSKHKLVDKATCRMLYNLSCVDDYYPGAEDVIKAVINIAIGKTTKFNKLLCMRAICRMSNVRHHHDLSAMSAAVNREF